MTNRSAATRYARALLDVAIREADPRQTEEQLAGFVDLVRQHAGLERALVNPAIPAARKRAVVESLLQKGGLSPVLGRLLLLLADRDRLVVLPELLAAYRDRLLDHLRVVRAEVTTAVALPPDRVRAIEDRLSKVTGKRIALEARVDPSIIGGVVARLGSVVYDGSVARHLARLREKLAGTVA
jgi:F-type H+-transporting ATPase subunit delta